MMPYPATIIALTLISVRLTRPGFSVATRSKHKASVGKSHKITPDEAKAYLTKEFGVSVY